MMPKRHIPWAAFAALVLVSNSLSAQPFFLRKDLPAGPMPAAVIPGDFNGDGRTDLAVATSEGIAVYLNIGGGNFSGPILTAAEPNTFWLAPAADFNNDGKDDLVGSGFIYLSHGDGTFQPRRYIGAQEAVAAADFNRDGKMDLIVADADWSGGNLVTHGVRVLLGNGDGTFQFGGTVTATAAVQVRVADFNRDGAADVAICNLPASPGSTPAILVFLGRGDGTFGPGIRTPIKGYRFLTADFNGDGLPDLFKDDGVRLGEGDGTFQSPVAPPAGANFPITAVDFTGDGKADLAVARSRAPAIAILTGRGDGSFSAQAADIAVSFSPFWAVALGDFDGDGRLDLAGVNGNSVAVSILMARSQDSPALRRAVSAASGTAIVAPNSLASFYVATNVAADAGASPPWPPSLGGISLEVRDSAGARRLAPLLYVSSNQINFRVPADTAVGEAALSIVSGAGTTEIGGMQVDSVAPGLFMLNPAVPLAAGVIVNPDGSQTPVPLSSCSFDMGCGLEAIPLSSAGGRPIYLSFFGTGFHGATTENVTFSANGMRLPVAFVGPQQTPGVDQINVQLAPKPLDTIHCEDFWGCDLVSVTIRMAGLPAGSFWLAVE
jgi:uncharacterized protein (TIGR03437 family)